MKSLILGLSIFMLSQQLYSQSGSNSEGGLRGVYLGVDVGSNFQEWYGGANLKVMFKNNWVISLDYFQGGAGIAKNLPDDYTDGANLMGIDETPKDFLDSYSLLFSKRRSLSKNTGLVFTVGPSLVYEKEAHFSSKENTWYESNYKTTYSTEQGWGAIGRIGAYWTATNWCAFQLEVLGNFNQFSSYGALCLSMNFGWLPKEK